MMEKLSYHQKITFERINEMKKPFSGKWFVVFKKMSEGVRNRRLCLVFLFLFMSLKIDYSA